MNLEAKASAGLPRRSACAEAGYAMAALLVGMAVMAVMLSVAMPTWSHMIRRDKEEELIFRGTQYARAFAQYQTKFANASPASLDVLVEQRMLRKKFKDPMSPNKDGEFALLYMSNQPQGAPGGGFGGPGAVGGTVGGGGARGTAGTPGAGTTFAPVRGGPAGGPAAESGAGGATYTTQANGPIMGVASKNTGASIKVYNGKKKYNEWYFVAREGGAGGAGGAGGPAGGIGGRGGPPGGRGGPGGNFPGSNNRGGGPGGGRSGSQGSFPGGGRGSMPSPPR